MKGIADLGFLLSRFLVVLSLIFVKIQVSRNGESSLQSINYPLVVLGREGGREEGERQRKRGGWGVGWGGRGRERENYPLVH